MGDKYMRDFQKFPGTQGMNIAQIKQDGAVIKEKGDKEPGVLKWTIDQPGMVREAHQGVMNLLTCLLMQ
jgi:hypothetical protein